MNRSLNAAGFSEIVAPDLASPAFKANPYPFYARLRAEAPVWRTTLRDRRAAWLVTRYEDVARVLKDDTFAKDKLNAMDPEQRAKTPWMPGFLKPLERNMLDLDDPDHTRLRALVSKAFTPRLVERLRGRIEALCEELLDAMEREAERRGGAELVADYALPLPATVIAELLGVPAEDRRQVPPVVRAGWSRSPRAATCCAALPAALAFVRYLRKIIERRRAEPKRRPDHGLGTGGGGGRQAERGRAPGHGVPAPGRRPRDHRQPDRQRRARPPRAPRAGGGAQERPFAHQAGGRGAAALHLPRGDGDRALRARGRGDRGHDDPRGELVLAVLGSANRDERHFEDPDVLDLDARSEQASRLRAGWRAPLSGRAARPDGRADRHKRAPEALSSRTFSGGA